MESAQPKVSIVMLPRERFSSTLECLEHLYAFYFTMAIKFNPAIGAFVPWSRSLNAVYKVSKPYFAVVYRCGASLISSMRMGKLFYEKA